MRTLKRRNNPAVKERLVGGSSRIVRVLGVCCWLRGRLFVLEFDVASNFAKFQNKYLQNRNSPCKAFILREYSPRVKNLAIIATYCSDIGHGTSMMNRMN
jgi:hypothetical protein